MHVVIAGCGRVGASTARALIGDDHSVSIIDKKPSAFERLPEEFTGRKLVGMVFDKDTLEMAGIREAGAFIAVTNGDNSNIVSARIAREYYNIQKVVARIYDPRRAAIYRKLGIPTIATVKWAAGEIYNLLFHGIENSELSIGDGQMMLLRFEVPAPLVGTRTSSIAEPSRALVAAIDRMGNAIIPGPDATFQQGDIAHIVVRRDALQQVQQKLGISVGA